MEKQDPGPGIERTKHDTVNCSSELLASPTAEVALGHHLQVLRICPARERLQDPSAHVATAQQLSLKMAAMGADASQLG